MWKVETLTERHLCAEPPTCGLFVVATPEGERDSNAEPIKA